MFKSLSVCLLSLSAYGALQAAVLTTNPSSGNITGKADQVVGWGFVLQPDATYWTSVVGSYLVDESNPAFGTYTDLIGPQGGPATGVLAPGKTTTDWSERFNWASRTGLGSYVISNGVLSGMDSGEIEVQLEFSSANPIDDPSSIVGFETLDVPFSVSVATPEPSTAGLFSSVVSLGCLLFVFGSLRRRKVLRS